MPDSSVGQSEALLVSDALGREQAIRLIRAVLDDEDHVMADNDGRAVKILLVLDHARRGQPPKLSSPIENHVEIAGPLGKRSMAPEPMGLSGESIQPSFLRCAICGREGCQQFREWGTAWVCVAIESCKDRQRKNGLPYLYHPFEFGGYRAVRDA